MPEEATVNVVSRILQAKWFKELTMGGLSLRFLGTFEVTLDGQPVTAFESDKARALLAYLVVEAGRPHRREYLAGLLWPEQPEAAARGNLRRALANVRDVTGDRTADPPFLHITRQAIQFNADSDHWQDSAAFEGVFNAPSPSISELEDAVALYQGDFLAGLSVPESIPFEEWSVVQRERLHQLMLDGLSRLARLHEATGAHEPALEAARRQLALEPWREEAHRQAMHLLAVSGQRGAALAQYDACCRILDEELGVEPSPQTTGLYQQIEAGQLTGEVSAPPPRGIRGYQLREPIGYGAFAAVYSAYHPAVGREVAIKVIRPEHANRPDFIRRFDAEARLVARLEHPYIVPLYDYWRDPDGAYLVMRWLRGGNLYDTLQQRPWTLEAASILLDQVAGALTTAHRRGVIHRDVKPANILLDEEGNAYLSDFGIARDMLRILPQPEGGLTTTGSSVWTPPEQMQGRAPAVESDIYSLGVVMCQVLAGALPFDKLPAENPVANLLAQSLPPPEAKQPKIPRELNTVLQRATASDPAQRYPSALAFAAAFRAAALPAAEEDGRPKRYPTVHDRQNPYKGLRPFEEADAVDFFGREALTGRLLRCLGKNGDGARFLAVVGPSGSGKSSVVKAGVVPALRRGTLPGSADWFVVEMVPGTHPLDELELGLLRIAARQPNGLREQLERDERGLLRAVRLVLPGDGCQTLLIIDQFEELYTSTTDEVQREHFLRLLYAAATDPQSPLRLLITLRADFYDRPLLHPRFSHLLGERTAVVVPLSPEELERAIVKPAEQVGVELEGGLASALVADVSEHPGALPMLQYALTELFERRQGRLLTWEGYEAIGGIAGAVASRAESVYEGLDPAGAEAARQLFFRLVALGESGRRARTELVGGDKPHGMAAPDTRRRALLGELQGMEVDRRALNGVLEGFGQARLLLFDRDPATRTPTVEIAHEALLSEWQRLVGWLEENREALRLQRRLTAAASDWAEAGEDASLLARGPRLEQFEELNGTSAVALTDTEKEYLQASLAEREARRSRRWRARRVVRMLQGAVGVAAVVAFLLALVAFNARSAALREAAVNHSLVLAAGAEQAQDSGHVDLALALALEAVDMAEPPSEAVRVLSSMAFAPGTRAVLKGHSAAVRTVAVSPDGRRALSGSCAQRGDGQSCRAGELILWDLETGGEAHRFTAHGGWINAVAFNPDGEMAASASADGTMVVWNSSSWESVQRLAPHEGEVTSAAFSPDGTHLLSGSADSTLLLWDLASGKLMRRFQGHTAAVNRVRFSADGQAAFSAGDDGLVILWDVATGEEIRRFTGHNSPVTDVAVEPRGETILTVGGDMSLRRWEVATAEQTQQWGGGVAPLASVAITPEGNLALFALNLNLHLLDLANWHESGRLLGHADPDPASVINEVVISRDGRLALSAGDDGTVRLWQLHGQRAFAAEKEIGAVAISPDGGELLVGGQSVGLWDVSSGRRIHRLSGSQGLVTPDGITFSPDGRYAAATVTDYFLGGEVRTVMLWEASTGSVRCRLEGHREGPRALAFSPDSHTLLSGSQNYMKAETDNSGDLILWDVSTCKLLRRFDTTEDASSIAFGADGRRALVSTAYYQNVTLWDVPNGQPLQRYPMPEVTTLSVTFGPEERTFLAGLILGNLVEVDLESGDVIRSFPGHNGNVWSVELSPDGRYLISGSDAGEVILWDYASGKEVGRYPGGPTIVQSVTFSPDGESAYFGTPEGSVYQWQVEDPTLEEVQQWVKANRYVRELTCEERERFHVDPLCEG